MTTTDAPMMVWTDVETTGLSASQDLILEVGFRITDSETLETIRDRSWTFWSPAHDAKYDELKEKASKGDATAKYIVDMHSHTGLWGEAMTHGIDPTFGESSVASWLRASGVGMGEEPEPLCGSSVGFDRSFYVAQMSSVANLFTYRVIDISSVKELVRKRRPEAIEGIPGNSPEWNKANHITPHRVLDDLTATIAEYKYYRDLGFVI